MPSTRSFPDRGGATARGRLPALCLALFALSANLPAAEWAEIDPADLTATASATFPGTDAEVLWREIIFDNRDPAVGAIQYDRYRYKVYTQAGVSALSLITMVGSELIPVSVFEARVIKPDGTIIGIDNAEIREREVRLDRVRTRTEKVFAPPQLEPGDIADIRVRRNSPRLMRSLFFHLASRWPTRRARLEFRSLLVGDQASRFTLFRLEKEAGDVSRDGVYEYTFSRIPAIEEEPYSPPIISTHPWVLFVQLPQQDNPEGFWERFAQETHRRNAKLAKPTKALTTKARALTAGITAPEAKLRALYDFCRTGLINTEYDPARRTTVEQRDAVENDDLPEIVMERGYGTSGNLRVLFSALANAAGFDARVARVGDRAESHFSKSMAFPNALPQPVVAVKIGEDWRFSDPSMPLLGFGELRWNNQATTALIADPKQATFLTTDVPSADDNRNLRQGRFTLDASGQLTGEISFQLTGQHGGALKSRLFWVEREQRLERLSPALFENLPDAQLTETELPDLDQLTNELKLTSTFTHPGYAEQLGDRLFVQPSVFEHGTPPLFTAETRATDLDFHHPWTDVDEIEIVLPEGFELENPSAPRSFDWAPFARYTAKLSIKRNDDGTRSVLYRREFFCLGNVIAQKFYPAIKEMFDEVHRQDSHTLALKRTAAVAAESP